MKRFALVALFATAPAALSAQAATTEDKLQQGIKAYEAFNVEQARPLFAEIVSPSNILQVSQRQKVTAYKYLGASYAVLAQPDSAERYFIAALDFDPFTDLDPVAFSGSELNAFAIAKTRIFRAAMDTVSSRVVNPRVDSTYYQFKIVTTHRANVTLELVSQDQKTTEVLFQGQNDGVKVIPWDGRLKSKSGAVADSGTYTLRLTAKSLVISGQDASTDTKLLRIEQSFDPLEDLLPALPDSMLLPEQLQPFQPWADLIKGTLVGASAYLLPVVILKSDPVLTSGGYNWKTHAFIGATIGVGSGVASWVYRSRNRKIDANVAENARRRSQRDQYNAQITARNNARLAQMVLIITPPGR
ncbi:MAG TPA: hypothetical protein VF483_06050 [Gemmatimonadaceae bacterium]